MQESSMYETLVEDGLELFQMIDQELGDCRDAEELRELIHYYYETLSPDERLGAVQEMIEKDWERSSSPTNATE